MPAAGSMVRWLLALAAFLGGVHAVQWLADRQEVPEFMQEIYNTAGLSAPLLIAIVLVAPLSEELLFRGFLYGGLAPSAIRPAGAAIISSLAWAVIHVQYDLFTIASIFVAGLLLAAARQATKSVIVCIVMHAAMNLVATIELAIAMR
jgi:membrane protease YdiL (CAAX protease family)